MKRTKILVLALVFILSAFAAGCSSSKAPTISDGVKSMQQVLDEATKKLDANNVDEFKKQTDALEENWEKFEDAVKEKSAEVYEKVEEPLHLLIAGSVDPLDKDALAKGIQDLRDALSEAEKLK